jgi:ATP-binding cassette subfamily B protein
MSPRFRYVGEEAPKGFSRKGFRRVLGWLRPHRRAILINVSLSLVLTAVTLTVPKLLKWTVDGAVETAKEIAAAEEQARGGMPAGESAAADAAAAAVRPDLAAEAWDRYVWVFVGFGGLFAFAFLVRFFEIRRNVRLGQRFMYEMRRRFFNHLHDLGLRFYDRMKAGQIISRGTSDMGAMEHPVSWAPSQSTSAAITVVAAGILMYFEDAWIFLAVLPVFPLMAGLTVWFRKRGAQAWRDVRTQTGRLTANVAESIAGARVIQAFAREQRNMETFSDLTSTLYETRLETARVHARYHMGLRSLETVGVLLLIFYGGYRVAEGQATPGTVVAFLGYTAMLFHPIQMLSELYSHLLHALAGVERITEVLDTDPEIEDRPDAWDPDDLDGHVRFDGVTFAYNPGVRVIEDMSFEVESGRTIALVGPTGAGKTTVCRLLARFYDIQRGVIEVDGRDLRDISQQGLHRHMGIVLQENFLFTGTVMDNIRYGRPDATDAEVIECARRIGSHRTIEGLPDGYQTKVGERGETLSAGQRQLVCYTRAMLADPRILILDEATSSVDTMTEARIQRALEVLLEGRTSFVVAHRLSTIRHADLVLVLDHGWIVERGTHKQLLATGGIYANLYRQFIRATEA